MTPSRTSSGTEPRRSATTGRPAAIASIIAIPNGSGQRIGMIRQRASCSSRSIVCRSPLSTSVTSSPSSGRTTVSRYRRSTGSVHLPASTNGSPAARLAAMARSGPLSAHIRASHSTGPADRGFGPNRVGSTAL